MRIYLLLAHPDKESFNGRIADAYEQTAIAQGHEVRRQNLGEMQFDPILWKGYRVPQPLEDDLVQAQQNLLWCQHWVIVYPIWWGSVPALLKGFFDRTLDKGFAYKYHKDDPFWDKLLKGRSAYVITTCDAPWIWIWWQYRNSDKNMVKWATLWFCGFNPIRFTRFDRLKYRDEPQRLKMLQKITSLKI